MTLSKFNLEGKVALLTGAGRGIGRAIARTLSEAGAAVAIQDIDLDIAKSEAQTLSVLGRRAIALGGDITQLADVETLIPRTVEQLGGLHILINNAAIQFRNEFTAHSADEIDAVFRANLQVPIRLCQLAVPIFRQQKWGRIINLGSIQGMRGFLGMIPYSMSKAAIANFTTALARDLGPHGITANCIAPGWFNTFRNTGDFVDPEKVKQSEQWIPLKRHGQPEDVGPLALLLASDAGSYITGQTIYVDGGMSVR